MSMNRREFVVLTCTLAAGCATGSGEGGPPLATGPVDAGPATAYAADGVYDRFQHQGFFVVREGEKLLALSSICTHRRCALRAEKDRSFSCKCHGSTFSPDGRVTEGPATRDLPLLLTAVDARGHLIVTVS